MLTELHISGLGVIDDAVLEPHSGFTVVTGETGAGKTMVVTALGLLTGGRGDAARVRVGAERAVVEARIAGPLAPASATAVDAVGGHLDDDGAVILVRSVGADGRSRAHVGGRSAPLGTLAEITDPLIAVHGQSEAIGLLRGSQQRAVLDRFAGSEAELARYRKARSDWQGAMADLADRTSHARERAQREQMLRLGVDEITKVDPKPGEDVDLIAEVQAAGERRRTAIRCPVRPRCAHRGIVDGRAERGQSDRGCEKTARGRPVTNGSKASLSGCTRCPRCWSTARRISLVFSTSSTRIRTVSRRCCRGRRCCAVSPGDMPRMSTPCWPGEMRPKLSSAPSIRPRRCSPS